MWEMVWISCLSGVATPVGGWLVLRFRRLSRRLLAAFLGGASGIMATVVLTELLPASIATGDRQLFLTGAAGGWIFLLLLRGLFASALKSWGLQGEKAAFLQMGWFIALAIALHDFPEGFAIGAGGALDRQVGLVIALAITLHNVPEGMSIALPLRLAGVSRRQIIWLTLLAGMTTPLGTIVSIWLLTVSDVFLSLSLAFAGGAMACVVASDILPEALRADKLCAVLGLAGGTVVMMAVSAVH